MLEYLRRRSAPSSNLLDIIAEVRTRWRLKLRVRGAVWVAGIGLLLLLALPAAWSGPGSGRRRSSRRAWRSP